MLDLCLASGPLCASSLLGQGIVEGPRAGSGGMTKRRRRLRFTLRAVEEASGMKAVLATMIVGSLNLVVGYVLMRRFGRCAIDASPAGRDEPTESSDEPTDE